NEVLRTDPVPNRDDIGLITYHTTLHSGTSDKITIEVSDQAESMLIEVQGPSNGLFHCLSFVSPDKTDLVESGLFVTRDAREVPGLVDWLFPNNDEVPGIAPGKYSLQITGQDKNGGLIDGDLAIRVYLRPLVADVANIPIDFVFVDGALDDGADP